ncbi:MAG TPA: GtrA family protein [Candidatus Paceibacterota bacterium]|nr:GtrA family protein [Candidatus Paceibacterota bacterium]
MESIKKLGICVSNMPIGRLFLNKKFAHYTWVGIFISLLNVFLLWLFIDILGIPTVISSLIVVAGTFILRYVLFDFFKIL